MAGFLRDADLVRMRRMHRRLLPDTCTIQTNTPVRTATGGQTRTWANTHQNVPCRVARLGAGDSASFEVVGEQPGVYANWMITVRNDQAVELDDRIVVAGRTFEPLDITDTHSFETGRRVLCRELTTG